MQVISKMWLLITALIFSGTALVAQEGFYNFTVQTLDGQTFEMGSLKGKKVMVVNTASKCGMTSQYEQLQALYEKYGSDNFVVIGFPANNFMNQEPGTDKEIREFCTLNYGVTFPMMAKISVKGEDQHPLYRWLTQKSENGFADSKVKWNFQKYLIGPDGQLEQVFSPQTKPDDAEIIDWITAK
jgi:glutathione peroxidase